MENVSRRVISAILGLALSVGSVTPVYAASGAGSSDVTLQVDSGEGPSIVSIKVPTEIPLKMDKEGAVTVPQDLKITNFSDSTDVELKGLSVIGKNAWVVKDYSEDLSSKPEGTKELSMSFRGDGTTSQGSVSLSQGAWVVNKSSELPLNVSAKLPKQSSGYKEKGSIAQVDYTFAVKDEPTDPAKQFTVNYIAGENGSVGESSRSFSEGSPLTFPSATPSEGYVFEKWVDNATGLDVTGSTMVNGNMTVKAVFKADESQTPIESTISNNWSKDKVIKGSVTPVTINYDSTSPDTHIVSVVSGNAFVTVEKAPTGYSLGNPGSEVWNVKAVGSGSATVTATLNTGETTQFVVNVYEVNVSGGGDVTVDVPNVPDKGPGDNLETGDITIDIPIKNPDGSDGTITVTPTIPPDTTLEEGENTITGSVTIDNVTINITIVITVEGSGSSNPSDGLTMTVPEAQAMGFTFSPYQDGLQIDSFENKQFKSEVNVPEQIGDFKVLSIKDKVFKGQTNLKRINTPKTVSTMGLAVFEGCTDTTVYSSAEKLSLRFNTFKDIKELHVSKQILTGGNDISSVIERIGSGKLVYFDEALFEDTDMVVERNTNDGFKYILSIGEDGNYIDPRTLSFYETSLNSPYFDTDTVDGVIPQYVNGVLVDTLPQNLVYYRNEKEAKLKTVYIPSSVTKKQFGTSFYCKDYINAGHITVRINNNSDVFEDGYISHDYCAVIYNDTPEVVNGVLDLNNGTQDITLDQFAYRQDIKTIIMPEGVTSIGEGAFTGCENLISVTIPSSVRDLGIYSFGWCTNLSSLTILEGLTKISQSAFEGCTKLSSVALPNSIEKIGLSAFEDCTSLNNVVIPSSVRTITNDAFAGVPHIEYHGSAGGAPWGAKSMN